MMLRLVCFVFSFLWFLLLPFARFCFGENWPSERPSELSKGIAGEKCLLTEPGSRESCKVSTYQVKYWPQWIHVCNGQSEVRIGGGEVSYSDAADKWADVEAQWFRLFLSPSPSMAWGTFFNALSMSSVLAPLPLGCRLHFSFSAVSLWCGSSVGLCESSQFSRYFARAAHYSLFTGDSGRLTWVIFSIAFLVTKTKDTHGDRNRHRPERKRLARVNITVVWMNEASEWLCVCVCERESKRASERENGWADHQSWSDWWSNGNWVEDIWVHGQCCVWQLIQAWKKERRGLCMALGTGWG